MRRTDSYTVYVVDDDEAVRDSLVALLEAEGLSVQPYSSVETFLDGFHPAGDACLLLDVQLPGRGGIELLDILSRREHHLPVIVITGQPADAVKKRALKAGAVAFIEKPFNTDELLDHIAKARP